MNTDCFSYFSTRSDCEYNLARGGKVRFNGKDVESVQPNYEDTLITLKNGKFYLLEGRRYGV